MTTFESFLLFALVFGGLAAYRLKKAAQAVSQSPAAKEIGLGLLRRFLGGK